MLPRKARAPVGELLRSRSRVLYSSPALTLKGKENGKRYNRYGVVVSVAVEPKSVRRHRLKRRILGVVRAWPPLSLDCVFILSRSICRLSSLELHAELARVFTTIRTSFNL